ncbi:chemotaxis protein CheY [Stutzerimonas stutzeri]|uniref:Chemotaxis protein CheY n=1 Tax=Stutzerimonas stutzeri TaxID=316 RepID=W8QZ13_STUST|nr:response regulator [Stutzerimonas stutzeri]AHL75509.1 chemotaxis protein CheY [Stutzerimonas stutzeri]MCQ4327920.1 response regulator [Stutzerimonas stutzeri]
MPAVCVVDDARSIRKSVANLLKSAGYEPVCFESGDLFLASPWRQRAACVLLDLWMPGMHGQDVLAVLRASGDSVPVICMSAHASETMIGQALAGGAVQLLKKPFTADALIEALANILKERP